MSALRRRRQRDAWRFLTPEVEREAPALAAALGSADSLALERELARLVVDGSEREWFASLRRLRVLLEAAATSGADRRTTGRLARILLDQYLLAPSVHDLDPDDEAELAALRTLVADHGRATADQTA